MTWLHLTRNELVVLGILALMTLLALFVPWKRIVFELREYEASKYSHGRNPEESDRPPPRLKPDWQVKSSYSAQGGKLRVTLSHDFVMSSPDLKVSAMFTPEDGVSPVARTFLNYRPGGVYGADNLKLSKGNWVMSLTGHRHLEFVFRREQVLKVE